MSCALLQNKSRALRRLWSLLVFNSALFFFFCDFAKNGLGNRLNLRSIVGVFVRVGLWMKGEKIRVQGRGSVASGSGCRGRRIPTIFQRNTQKRSPTRTKCGLFSGKAQSWKLYRTLGNGKYKICREKKKKQKKCLQAMKSISANILEQKRAIPRAAHAFKLSQPERTFNWSSSFCVF